jgi:tRNA-dihydrouridine synthase B
MHSPFSALTQHSRLKTLGIEFPFMVAPMVGLTNVAFREMIRAYVPQGLKVLTFTEMLSTRRLPNEKLETTNEAKCAPGEEFFIPQILGNEEKFIAPSLRKLLTQNPWGFDINMGCPVTHTLRHNWGVRLMGDKTYAAEVVRMTKAHSTLPVSVKLRGGGGDVLDVDELKAFTDALEQAGADWLTIHPRPRSQGHKGLANWDLVSQIRKVRSIPVVANGDIQTCDDALSLLENYGADGAMVARAATARPWIFWQIAEKRGYDLPPSRFPNSKAPATPEEEGQEYIRACLILLEGMQQHFPDELYILEKFAFFAATGARWFPFGHAFWKMATKAKSVPELISKVTAFGENSQNPMYSRIKFL